ncbi:hypothetical protein ACIQLJ_13295 [Microbacterium sp. NPDC091313]
MIPATSASGPARARRCLDVVARAVTTLALVAGLLATPTGIAAAAAPGQPGDPTAAPEETATPAPADSATPATTDAPQSPAPGGDESAPPDAEPEASAVPAPPAAADSDATSAPGTQSPDARAPPASSTREAFPFAPRAAIGILAAGVPEQPAPVWTETFEQGLNTTAPSSITTYATSRFTAATAWATGTNCTGVLVNYTATYPNTAFCPNQGVVSNSSLAAREVRRLADVLGQVAAGVVGGTAANAPVTGSTAATRTNHALVAYPYATVTAGTTVAQTTSGVGASATASRYYTLQLDAAGANCSTTAANNAALNAALVSGTTVLVNAFSSPVIPCTTTGSVFYASSPALPNQGSVGGVLDPAISASARAATFTGNTSVLLTPAQISAAQVRIQNATSTPAGAGFGVDNVRVLDVTPSLDWAFSPTSVTAGTPSTLTYTVTNTSELAAKADWSFSHTLPAGLAVAATQNIGGTCTQVTGTAYAVTAVAGSATVTATGGDLAAGAASCTVTVDVVAAESGSFTIAPAAITTVLVPGDAATLTVTPATRITVRKNLPARTASTDQFTLSLRSGATVLASATTTGNATGLQSDQITRFIVSPNTAYTIHETPTAGAALGYASTYECTRDGTVIAAGASRSGSITTPSDAGAEVVCTFTNALQQPQLACDSGLFYSVTTAGALLQADIVNGGQATVGTWPNATGANSLGVGAGGSLAYAVNRSTDAASVLSMLKWSTSGGFETLANTAYTTVTTTGTAIPGSIVAGAVDLTSNRYIFGKFNAGLFHLWSFTEANPAASRYAYLGSFSTGAAPNGNGDMAFDSRGNLYVLGAATVNNASSAAIFTISAETLAGAAGGTLPVSTSNTRALTGLDASPAFGSVNGIAFSPRGTIYLSSNTSAYEFDPTSWTRVAGSPRIDMAATDLATCTGPGTVSVLKNVVGRAAAADQFQVTLADPSGAVGSATTSGAATGRQSAQVGPFPVRVGTALTVSEAMATGSTSVIGAYTIRVECWSDGIRIANGTAASLNLTMPDRFGANVVCTFFNSPSPVATVTVTKRVLDPATGVSTPAAGWSLGTAATATVGSATVLPSEAPRQVTDATGTATWTVLFGGTTSRATLVISEVQQTRFTFVSGSCTVNGTTTAVSFTTAGSTVSGSLPNVAPSATIACTLVNQPLTTMTLVKNVSFGSALPAAWTLTATAPAGALAGPTGVSGTPATTSIPVSPGRVYRLSESTAAASYVQVGPWSCVDGTGAAVPVTAAGDVTPATGAALTCTVTNATAAITLLKQVVTPGPGFQPAQWTITATPGALAGATLPTQSRVGAAYDPVNGNAANRIEVRPGHPYTLSEAVTTPSRLAYQQLRLERLEGTTWVTVTGTTITAPAAGQSAVYRFVNAPVQPLVLPVTGGMGADTFLFAGGAVLALVLAAGLLHGWRRRWRWSS